MFPYMIVDSAASFSRYADASWRRYKGSETIDNIVQVYAGVSFANLVLGKRFFTTCTAKDELSESKVDVWRRSGVRGHLRGLLAVQMTDLSTYPPSILSLVSVMVFSWTKFYLKFL